MPDLLTIVGLTLGSCLAVGLVGGVLLHLGHRWSMRYLRRVCALLSVLAVLAAALVNARCMFLSARDAGVILIGLGISAALAAGGAWWVTRRITTASRAVGLGLSSLVADSAAG